MRSKMKERYEFKAVIEPVPEKGGAFVRGQLIFVQNSGKADVSICYIIGIRKDIQKAMNKGVEDEIHVVIIPIH